MSMAKDEQKLEIPESAILPTPPEHPIGQYVSFEEISQHVNTLHIVTDKPSTGRFLFKLRHNYATDGIIHNVEINNYGTEVDALVVNATYVLIATYDSEESAVKGAHCDTELFLFAKIKRETWDIIKEHLQTFKTEIESRK